MKFIKIVVISSVIATTIFGAEAFGRGGHGGGGGGFSAGFGGHSGFDTRGTTYGGAITSGSSYGGVGASSGLGHSASSTPVHAGFRGHRPWGRGFGYGYGYGYGTAFYGPGWEDEQITDSDPLGTWNREQDRRRAQLPASTFVKNYSWPIPAVAAKSGAGTQ